MTNSDNLLHLVSTGQHHVFEKHLYASAFGIFPPSALFFLSSVESSPSPVECNLLFIIGRVQSSRRPGPGVDAAWAQRYYCKQKEPEVQNLRQISI